MDNFQHTMEKNLIPVIIEKILREEVEEGDEFIIKKQILENYNNNKEKAKFLNKFVLLCKDCYLDNTNYFTKKKTVKLLPKQRKPLYIDYKSLDSKTDYLSEYA